MIVGAPKCGSTALFAHLASHPHVRAHVHRELPFFGRDEEFARGWGFAVDKYFPPGSEGAPLVAKHTMALYDPVALGRIARSTPAVAVAVLRDPVPRAYSHYLYARLRGWEDAPTFEEGLRREPARPRSSPPRARDLQYVRDGLYAEHVRELLATFPADRVRVRTSDELATDPGGVCGELFGLAGLAPYTPTPGPRSNERRAPRSAGFARAFLALQQPGSPLRAVASRLLPSRTLYRVRHAVNRLNETASAAPAMADQTASALRARFAESDAALEALLGRPLVGWT
jgi:hypothetical protein